MSLILNPNNNQIIKSNYSTGIIDGYLSVQNSFDFGAGTLTADRVNNTVNAVEGKLGTVNIKGLADDLDYSTRRCLFQVNTSATTPITYNIEKDQEYRNLLELDQWYFVSYDITGTIGRYYNLLPEDFPKEKSFSDNALYLHHMHSTDDVKVSFIPAVLTTGASISSCLNMSIAMEYDGSSLKFIPNIWLLREEGSAGLEDMEDIRAHYYLKSYSGTISFTKVNIATSFINFQ